MTRAPYPSDLTAAQWERLAPLLPPPLPGGRPRSVDLREVLNAIFYLNRQGCVWRALPHDLPPWGTVSYYYRRWRRDGTWQGVVTLTSVRTGARDPLPTMPSFLPHFGLLAMRFGPGMSLYSPRHMPR